MTRRIFLSASSLLAQDVLDRKPSAADARIPYGTDANQFGDLRLPPGVGPHPLVINIHGGFWRAAYNLEHNGHLCEALRKKGIATWSMEYRRVGQAGGGWPGTFDDAKAAAQFALELPKNQPIDPSRVIVMGHSAGGHLALWLGAELSWLQGVISLAGVADLAQAHQLNLSRGIVREFLAGTPDEVPERYRLASPIARIPLKRPAVLIHGENDNIVPITIARAYEKAARAAGDNVELHALPDTGHFELIDPEKPQWATVERAVRKMLRVS